MGHGRSSFASKALHPPRSACITIPSSAVLVVSAYTTSLKSIGTLRGVGQYRILSKLPTVTQPVTTVRVHVLFDPSLKLVGRLFARDSFLLEHMPVACSAPGE
jgi:hypothetical protein